MAKGISILPDSVWKRIGSHYIVSVENVEPANVRGGYNIFIRGPGKNPLSISDFLEHFKQLRPTRKGRESGYLVNGEVMRQRRESMGLSFDALAQRIEQVTRIKLTKQALHQVERGRNGAMSKTINAIALVLDLDPRSLIKYS